MPSAVPRLTTAVALLAALASAPAGAQELPADSGPACGRTVLLVDDHDVLYRSGTERVFHPPRRHSDNALIAQTKPWETAIGWTSVYRDPDTGKYQLWYQAYVGHRAGDRRYKCVVCYAESKDGIHFDKPELDLFPYKDNKKTNIVLIGNGGYGDRYCNSVVVDPEEKDPARRYKMAYYDWSVKDGREYPGLHVAFSPDGIHWTKYPGGPLFLTSYGNRGIQPPFADEDPYAETPVPGKATRKRWAYPLLLADAFDVFWDPVCRVWVIFGKVWLDGPEGTGAWKHAMARTESKDFLHWSRPELILTPDDRDADHVEFHTTPVFYHAGRYFCLNQIFHRKLKGAIDVELMVSKDSLTWERPFRDQWFLARSKPGLFDSRSIFTNATPVVLDDEIRFYYGAYNQSPLGGVSSEPGQRSGVGLAVLPCDRFAGVRPVARSAQPTLRKPVENVGQVTLKPLDLTGCKELLVNADAGAGAVRVELLTAEGYRVRGFTKDEAVPLRGDSLRHRAAWAGRRLEQLPAGRYLLRLHMDNATVYAVTLR